MTNKISPSGVFFPAPIRTPVYENPDDMIHGRMARPWVHWFQLTAGAAMGLGGDYVIWITAAPTTTIDCQFRGSYFILLDQDITLVMENAQEGQRCRVVFIQDASGNHTVTLASGNFSEGKDATFAIAAEANTRSETLFSYDGIQSIFRLLACVRGDLTET